MNWSCAGAAWRPTSRSGWASSACGRCWSGRWDRLRRLPLLAGARRSRHRFRARQRDRAHRALPLHHRRRHVPDRVFLSRRDERGSRDRAGPVAARVGGLDLVVVSPNDPDGDDPPHRGVPPAGIAFAADPSQQLARMDGAEIRQLFEGADVPVCNDYEKGLMLQKTGWTDAEVSSRVGIRVTTHGAKGVVIELRGRAGGPGRRRPGDEGRPDRCRRRVPRRVPRGPRVGSPWSAAPSWAACSRRWRWRRSAPRSTRWTRDVAARLGAAYGPGMRRRERSSGRAHRRRPVERLTVARGRRRSGAPGSSASPGRWSQRAAVGARPGSPARASGTTRRCPPRSRVVGEHGDHGAVGDIGDAAARSITGSGQRRPRESRTRSAPRESHRTYAVSASAVPVAS